MSASDGSRRSICAQPSARLTGSRNRLARIVSQLRTISILADEPRFGLLLLLAVLARLGPRAILGIAAGSLIDRSPLRRLLVSIDVLR